MVPHRYKIGQKVRFFQRTVTLWPRTDETHPLPERYEVTRLLPSNGAEFQYRIKGCTKGQERVVSESEIG